MSWYEARDEAGREWAREHANEMMDDGDFDDEIGDRILAGDFDDIIKNRIIDDGAYDDAVMERMSILQKEDDGMAEDMHEAMQDKILAQQELEDYAKDDSPYEPDDRWEGEC